MKAEEFIKQKDSQFRKNLSLIPMKDIGRKGKFYFKREAWTFLPQCNLDKKVFVFERLRKVKYQGSVAFRSSWKKDDLEYRIGYFIVGKIGRAKNRWIWGQFCPLIPVEDFEKLLRKARKEKVLI